jgi:RNA polymerase sigma-70 factor (ECF subfamily)
MFSKAPSSGRASPDPGEGAGGSSASTTDEEAWVRRAAAGDAEAREALFSRFDSKLRRMIRMRLDRRLQGRLDEADVLQEVYLQAVQRFPSYLEHGEQRPPFLLWLRLLTGQVLVDLHRGHLGVQARDPRREVHLDHAIMPEATSEVLAAQLVGRWTSASQQAMREEVRSRVLETLQSMDARDREVLSLRHFEHLSNKEVAIELGLNEYTASKRYLRALSRLKSILSESPGGRSRWM